MNVNFLEEKLPKNWKEELKKQSERFDFSDLSHFIEKEYQTCKIYPEEGNIFRAFELTSFAKVKVVILGQDPYHGINQAHGLSFSVKEGVRFPPSLRNILKEYQEDIGLPEPKYGDLTKWACQGVLLLNTVLTVREAEANSHANQGWEVFTDLVIKALSASKESLIFVLWGKPSQAKNKLITDHHFILEAPHPSPLSAYRGFFGSKPFSKVNKILQNLGRTPIDWELK
ncbi:MAG: uracil-DNA glycosylase [Lactobacillales bacterium]|jgi:uracil-DNA glycosylase|nr:uracil-DNA glycosylase [Lactobacillales bacterium]